MPLDRIPKKKGVPAGMPAMDKGRGWKERAIVSRRKRPGCRCPMPSRVPKERRGEQPGVRVTQEARRQNSLKKRGENSHDIMKEEGGGGKKRNTPPPRLYHRGLGERREVL